MIQAKSFKQSHSSKVIQALIVTYCDKAKIALSVPANVLSLYSVYSEVSAIEMAIACIINKANEHGIRSGIGVGITGLISGYDPNYPDTKPGDIYIGVVFSDKRLGVHLSLKIKNAGK